MKQIIEYVLIVIAIFSFQTSRAQWNLAGNAIAAGNFLGTTNSFSLVFKVNSSFAGTVDVNNQNTYLGLQTGAALPNTTGKQNTSIGYTALGSNTTGIQNVAIGYTALTSNTTGTGITAVGSQSLQQNTGSYSTAVGLQSLIHNTTGVMNNAFGSGALWSTTTGTYNSAFGGNSLYFNTTGSYNTATGVQALFNNTADGNTATGYQSLYSTITGVSNTAVGYQALFLNTGNSYNTGIGYQVLYNNTGGGNVAMGYHALYSNTSGQGHTAVGYEALYNNTGDQNTAFGDEVMFFNTTGSFNTAVGESTLLGNSTGTDNSAFGKSALGTNTTGSGNTAIGFAADVNSNNYSNTTVLGQYASGTASNQVRIGNSSVTSIGGYVNWSNISDGRVKKNIKENVPGLAFIKKLRAVSYNLDLDAADKLTQKQLPKDKNGKVIILSQDEITQRQNKEKIVYTGFIAQEVEKSAKELKFDFSGIDVAKNEKDLYGLRYSDFIAPLVKSVQELSAQNDSLKTNNQQLQSQIYELSKRIDALAQGQQQHGSVSMQSNNTILQSNSINESSLDQNAPNPFTDNTIITYHINKAAINSKIVVADVSGNVLKEFSIGNNTTGHIVINGDTLSSGIYLCTLIVDSKIIDTKKIVLTR